MSTQSTYPSALDYVFESPQLSSTSTILQSRNQGNPMSFEIRSAHFQTWAESSPQAETSTDMETEAGDARLRTRNYGELVVGSGSSDQDKSKNLDSKMLRRLAQNREAARKSRLRKKAYVQQLETSRVRSNQIEQELERIRQHGSHSDPGRFLDPGSAAFDMEYARWMEGQNKHTSELRSALAGNIIDTDLRILVKSGVAHFDELFRLKNAAIQADVFHILSGGWKTPAERCFMWMGGFRPSELLKILAPQIEALTEEQLVAICKLQQSSQQAEDALSQSMKAVQHSLAEALSASCLEPSNVANYMGRMAMAMGKLSTVETFVRQADSLRQQALQQMHRILTTRQAAKGLLALGDYFSCLRALSALWIARPREP